MAVRELVPNDQPLSWNKEQGKRFWLWAITYIYTPLFWAITKFIIKTNDFNQAKVEEITHPIVHLWYSQRTLATNKESDNQAIVTMLNATGFSLVVIPTVVVAFPVGFLAIITQIPELGYIVAAPSVLGALCLGIFIGIYPFAEGFNFINKKKGEYIHRHILGPGIIATIITMILGIAGGILGTYFIYFIAFPSIST